jgi:hypothetical protein
MADIWIENPGGTTDVRDGAPVTLKARATPGTTGYEWRLNGVPIPAAVSPEHNFVMGVATDGEYIVEAKLAGKPIRSNPVTFTRAIGEDAPEFHRLFAIAAAIALVVVGVLLFLGLQYLGSRILVGDFYRSLEGRLKVAVVLGLPTMVVGTVVVLVGAWMAIVEWRGRLRKPASNKVGTRSVGAGEVKEIIGAVGNLRGAALVIVVGAILMLGTAWIAQSAAGTAGPAAAPGASGALAP